MNNRIINHPILDKQPFTEPINFSFNGKLYTAYEGDTIASALLANHIRILRFHEQSGKARGIYCNIGHCFECRVRVNGQVNIRACLTKVEEGMIVESETQKAAPLDPKKTTFPKTYAEYLALGEEEQNE